MNNLFLPIREEIIADNFAGGGGASTGIAAGFGRPVDVAVNHDPEAVALHAANHPETRHYCESVFKVDPEEITGNQPVALAWFSPDCKHFSKAKGGRPVSPRVRGLAWVVIRWARRVKPRAIMLENVEEFETWGPCDAEGNPVREKAGMTFRLWLNQLKGAGYKVEYRILRACDYGAPTIRKRLFLIARRDGLPIVWPKPTHGHPDSKEVKRGKLKPWRTAAEVIDWSIPCPSIFDRQRPLAEATMRRIAAGVMRYCVNNPKPFIVPVTHSSRGPQPIDEPLRTVTTANGGEFALAVPTMIQVGYGERNGQDPRVPGLEKPLGTVVAGGGKHALVSAFLAQHNTGVVGHDAREPVSTIVGKGCTQAVVQAAMVTKLRGDNIGHGADEPLHTVSAGGTHFAEVRAFLIKYYGTDQDPRLDEPMHTVTTKERFGLVTVEGVDYQIVDIGMRMLTPRELYRAQGFPDSYKIEIDVNGKPLSKAAQVRMCGNSVCPPVAEALVRANFAHEKAWQEAA